MTKKNFIALAYKADGTGFHLVPAPVYTMADWQHEVANGDTVLGYAEWLEHKHEADKGAR